MVGNQTIKSLSKAHLCFWRLTKLIMRSSLFLVLVYTINQSFAENGLLYQQTNPSAGDKCISNASCKGKQKYRSIDGSCNNPQHPNWGRAGTPLVRVSPARYSDGVEKLPTSKTGGELPNALGISAVSVDRVDLTVNDYSTALGAWAQVIMYDTAQFSLNSGPCCSNGKPVKSAGCASVSPPAGEEDQFESSCLEVIRTRNTKNLGCKVKPVQQIDRSSHFLDLSSVYGNSVKIARSLRTFKGGELKIMSSDEKRDANVNSYVNREYLHAMFAKEHNRVAAGLSKLNSGWKDEKLYQEARRIVIAQYQQISLYEMLPLLTGTIWEEEDSRRAIRGGRIYPSSYNSHIHPGTINEVAAGCFYFYIDLVPGIKQSSSNDNGISNASGSYEVEEFNDELGEKANQRNKRQMIVGNTKSQKLTLEDNLRGLKVGVLKSESFFKEYQRRALLARQRRASQNVPPVELAAFHIQKGRDHGLASYNQVREATGRPKATNFSDFEDVMDKDNANHLSKIYKSVDDVDLLVGVVLEKKEPLAVMGPTCNRLTEEQFRRWKLGDRFWFEHQNQAGSFTEQQLYEIDKTTLARLICDNGGVERIPKFAFWQTCLDNPEVDCTEIQRMSLEPWKE